MSKGLAQAVGRRLRRLREARGWTQEQLAHRTAIGRSQLCRYENGVCRPNTLSLLRLAEELGVTTDEILGLPAGAAGHASEPFEAWLLRFPRVHHAPLRNLVRSYLKAHGLGALPR